MSGFLRVRAVDGPKHEFDAPVGEVEAHPDLYEVLDLEPSPVSREPRYDVDNVIATPLEKLKRSELDDLARPLGIDPTAAKSKPDLIALINAAPGVPTLDGTDSPPAGDVDNEPAGTLNKEKN